MSFLHPTDPPPFRACAHPSCPKEGLFRAPRGRDGAGGYVWFCLEHIRVYNAAWNYFADASAQDIEKAIRRAAIWDRPTWPLGRSGALARTKPFATSSSLPEAVRKALAALDLEPPVSLAAIKRQWRVLAKRYHPDSLGGSRAGEEKFHDVQRAFAVLRAYYTRRSSEKRT